MGVVLLMYPRDVVSAGACWLLACLTLLPLTPDVAGAQHRRMQPEDLFRLERIGNIAWTPDSTRAAVEIHGVRDWLDPAIPGARMVVVDATTGSLRVVASPEGGVLGFFRPAWSPDGRHLLFFSVDTGAVIRPWLWRAGSATATMLGTFRVAHRLADPASALWTDPEHVILVVRDSTRGSEGLLHPPILRGHNVVEQWERARAATEAAVRVMESRVPGAAADAGIGAADSVRLISVNVETGVVTVLAEGDVRRPVLARDEATLTYRRRSAPLAVAPASGFLGPDAQDEAAYDLANWGDQTVRIDVGLGRSITRDATHPRTVQPFAAQLRVVNTPSEGTRLLLARPGQPDTELWAGNSWVKEIETGSVEMIRYHARGGEELTGWLLYPPGHQRGRRIPIVTVVYPGAMYGTRTPPVFDVLNAHFEHPQLFAALGYGVLLPSIPEPERPLQSDVLDRLADGILPLLDTLVARGIADSSRIAVLGQSAGGWATLGLIATTARFRTAIASASYGNLASLYGTFYGQYRHGDGGDPQHAQLLRILQFERGYFGAAGPPWDKPTQYSANSPLFRAASVQTPLMLIHGELDFIPVQQAEEFFTALYRQDKRVRLVRYAGEGHTISSRANVLDMWHRIESWLDETMPAGGR